jgi:hypothetical protein
MMKIPPLLLGIFLVYVGVWYWFVPGALLIDVPVAALPWLAW